MGAEHQPATTPGCDPAPEPGHASLAYQLQLVAKSARANFEGRLHDVGASFATFRVLETLVSHGPMIQTDLAEALVVRSPTATRTLDRMIASGLVERRSVTGDRRKTEIAVTEEGERLLCRLTEIAEETNQRLAEGFSPRELETLRSLLSRVHDNTR